MPYGKKNWCCRAVSKKKLAILLGERIATKFDAYVGEVIGHRFNDSKCLGRITSEDDDDSLAIEAKLKKARANWVMCKRLLTREYASRRVMGYYCKAIVTYGLPDGAET